LKIRSSKFSFAQLFCLGLIIVLLVCSVNQDSHAMKSQKNVLGQPLQICCEKPMTGFTRNGKCESTIDDSGLHTVCAVVTKEFLEFTKSQGNDLITPRSGFPGLKAGDKWCLCVGRWKESLEAGYAPPIIFESTNESVLKHVDLEVLEKHKYQK